QDQSLRRRHLPPGEDGRGVADHRSRRHPAARGLRALRPGPRNRPAAGSIDQLMPRRFSAPLTLAGWILLAAPLPAQSGPELPIDTALARRHFQQASALTARDGGRLWGRSLAGPILFVDPATRAVLADSADLEGLLRPLGG